jgi:hypothetical protein
MLYPNEVKPAMQPTIRPEPFDFARFIQTVFAISNQ